MTAAPYYWGWGAQELSHNFYCLQTLGPAWRWRVGTEERGTVWSSAVEWSAVVIVLWLLWLLWLETAHCIVLITTLSAFRFIRNKS